MSAPVALGAPSLSPSPPENRRLEFGANALTAPTTPGRRMPMIDKSKVDPQIRKAAEGMEAMFIDYLMKVMRQTVPKNDMDLESPATEIYRSMQDSDMAERAARAGGVGLADQIIAYLDSQRYTGDRGKVAPEQMEATRRTGGTYENQSDRD